MTEKLYYKDSFIKEFSAKVLSCSAASGNYDGKFEVVLDKTAFFPEGGGQTSDTGKIGDVEVVYVCEAKDGAIIHYTKEELYEGKEYFCMLDFESRFRKMQNHSGEHVVSGIVKQLYGFDNVGFHLGSKDVTIDYNGVLNREDLLKIEYLANKACAENLDIICSFPDGETLKKLNYRSKKELTGDIRIVEIPGCDICACCAPHVRKTGEIGMIKLLDFISYKGGVRVHMKCGLDALDDYNDKYRNVAQIAQWLSAKQTEAAPAVEQLLFEISKKKQECAELSKKYVRAKLEAMPKREGNLLYFDTELDAEAQREAANIGREKCTGVFLVCCGNDNDGYRYVMSSESINLKEYFKNHIKLPGGGGGTEVMMQGMFKCTRAEIEAAFGGEV